MMENSRLKNSIYNSMANFFLRIITIVLSFVVRTIFIKILGEQLLGLDGLLTNILSLLSLAELGLSTAISFSLYGPLASKDNEKISQLIVFYRGLYKRIAIFIAIVGVALMPFLKFIVKDYTALDNIYLIYLIYLINTVSTYFISYSAILIEADQKNYRLSKITILFDLLTYSGQVLVLLFWKNFILYLIVQFVFRFLQRAAINNYIQKNYKSINFKTASDLTKAEKNKIKTDVKGLLFHRFGDYAVNSTDNILISSIVNISTTGIYSNYLSLISVFNGLITSIMAAPTSSMGNLNVSADHNANRKVFELINYVCYFITGITVVGVYFCINDFITVWLGEKYLLSNACVIVISLNLFFSCIMQPIRTVKSATGLYYVDRFVPVLQAVINLIVSVVAGIMWGIFGILIATTISYIVVALTLKPYYIYKYVFKTSPISYYYEVIKNILFLVMSCFITTVLLMFIPEFSGLTKVLLNGILSSFIFIIVFIIFTFNTQEFKYYKDLILKFFNRKRG